VRYRVDELAARAGTSVDTVRFYQTKGLLHSPDREGRIAWYGDDHVERLNRIQELKTRGLTLTMIARVLQGELDATEEALLGALAGPLPGEERAAPEELLTRDELARRTAVSPALLAAVERDGLLVPRAGDGEPLYTAADAKAVSAGLALLEAGLPLSELLALARDHNRAMQEVARRAVDLFVRFVRDPIRASEPDEKAAAERLVAAFHEMFDATSDLVAHHFRRVLLAQGLVRIQDVGAESELETVRKSAQQGLD
jgi:DNA-binding transcriptional MerR regulator